MSARLKGVNGEILRRREAFHSRRRARARMSNREAHAGARRARTQEVSRTPFNEVAEQRQKYLRGRRPAAEALLLTIDHMWLPQTR